MPRPNEALRANTRRRFLKYFSGLGLTSTLLPGVLWAGLEESGAQHVTVDMLREAEKLAGHEFTDSEREMMVAGLNEQLERYEKLRAVELSSGVPPAIEFQPLLPGMRIDSRPAPARPEDRSPVETASLQVPSDLEDLAFWPVSRLGELVRGRRVSSVDLTKMYLSRLKRHDATLRCVVTLTEELAMKQAKRADEEIAAGRYRGPLHGIPWGAKDLLAAKGYPTTWGAMPYREQVIDEDATVVKRLEEAGAVLIAKLSLGALAWGDVWYGGRTRNPWNPEQGSSGSSAGPAAATAAGLVGFSIGSETWGSIVSPSTVCGVTGLRPTFGRVSRHGAMALSWSMDKIGPMCRSVGDCATVLEAIAGPDDRDGSLVDTPFAWAPEVDLRRDLRVGYVKSAFAAERPDKEWKANDEASLDALRTLGVELRPIELPDRPIDALSFILTVEAAAAFDELTRSGRDDLLVRQVARAWPNVFRQGRMIPAVEYVQANRVRTLVMRDMRRLMDEVDVYVAPSLGRNLLLTNLTGHPAVVVPNGFRPSGTPTSITFTGSLFGETPLLALAAAYQEATGFHRKHPTLGQ